MNLDHLSDLQVENLIVSLKKMQNKIQNTYPMIGKIKEDNGVLGEYDGILYILHRYRHPIDTSRYSIHIRFKEVHHILFRLDINNGSHRNPDGSIVPPNHVHVYKDDGSSRKDSYAYPIPTHFTDLSSIFSAFEDFLVYNSIKEIN